MAEQYRRPARGRRPQRTVDLPRRVAFEALDMINGDGAYANLAVSDLLAHYDLDARDAGFVTELVFGTCRMQGSYDEVIAEASGRSLESLQPEVVDILRLAAHQIFDMRVPRHAAVATTVDLAGVVIGEKVTGLVNAVVRRMSERGWDEWVDQITTGMSERDVLSLRYGHPRWIVDALADALHSDDDELKHLLIADNTPATPTLVVRPGLADRQELIDAGAKPTAWSPWGAVRAGNPGDLVAVRQGRAGVQDEGSQLVIQAATAAAKPGRWLDMCAGPGGKTALLRGVNDGFLVASEVQPHRAELVSKALRAWQDGYQVIVADGQAPAWANDSFGLVLADVPCTGLGALRRRPESRWLRDPRDVADLVRLQRSLLETAMNSVEPGGVLAYVTCSPHPAETVDVVASMPEGWTLLDGPGLIPQVPEAASRLNPRAIQLWPHVHGTDAMFAAIFRRDA